MKFAQAVLLPILMRTHFAYGIESCAEIEVVVRVAPELRLTHPVAAWVLVGFHIDLNGNTYGFEILNSEPEVNSRLGNLYAKASMEALAKWQYEKPQRECRHKEFLEYKVTK